MAGEAGETRPVGFDDVRPRFDAQPSVIILAPDTYFPVATRAVRAEKVGTTSPSLVKKSRHPFELASRLQTLLHLTRRWFDQVATSLGKEKL